MRKIYDEVKFDATAMTEEHGAEFNANASDKVIFVERAQAISRKLVQPLKKDVTPLTVILLNQEYFGVDPEIIKEFYRIDDFTPIPSTAASPFLLGFINVRGEILTLIDVWQVLKSQRLELKKTSKILVITVQDLIVGVLVDDILDVIFVKPEELQAVPLGMQKAHEEYIKNTVLYEKDVLGVLSLTKVVETILHTIDTFEK
jgi:purine-binding chemotaxis protein CheW